MADASAPNSTRVRAAGIVLSHTAWKANEIEQFSQQHLSVDAYPFRSSTAIFSNWRTIRGMSSAGTASSYQMGPWYRVASRTRLVARWSRNRR